MPGTALVGAGAGLVMAPLSSAAMAQVPHQKAGMAAGAVATFRQLGYAFGIAVLGEVFSGGLTRVAGSGLAPALSGGEASAVLARRPGLSLPVHEAFAAGLDQTLLVATGLGIIGALAVFAFANGERSVFTPSTRRTQERPLVVVGEQVERHRLRSACPRTHHGGELCSHARGPGQASGRCRA